MYLHFDDGTIVDFADLLRQNERRDAQDNIVHSVPSEAATDGYAGNDILLGTPGNNIFIGGPGDDTVNGNGGVDTYIYNKGDGRDTISLTSGEQVKIVFGEGIMPADVSLFNWRNLTSIR